MTRDNIRTHLWAFVVGLLIAGFVTTVWGFRVLAWIVVPLALSLTFWDSWDETKEEERKLQP